jgi:hypothetical protein
LEGVLTLLFAIFGGFAVQIINLIELRSVSIQNRPKTFSDPLFVLQFFIFPIMGGVLAYAYEQSGTSFTPILAINIGASAPLILRSFATVIPTVDSKTIN